MARGRKAEPAEVKLAKGNPGRRRIAQTPTDARDLATAAPPDLADAAKTIWDRLAPELSRLKFLRDTDRNAFARYCEHLGRWWVLTTEMRTEGETYLSKSEHNPEGLMRINPKFFVREKIERRMEFLEDRFGLSPMARRQILQRLAGMVPFMPGKQGEADLLTPAQPDAPAAPAKAPAASPVGLLARAQVH